LLTSHATNAPTRALNSPCAVDSRARGASLAPMSERASESAGAKSDDGSRAEFAPSLRLALAGGGTGGHIVPGLHLLAHVCEEMPRASHAARDESERAPQLSDVVWFTSGRAVEERVMSSARARSIALDIDRVALSLEPEGGGAPSRSALFMRTPAAAARARRALARHRSDVLLGLGGFTTLPAVIAARSLGIPVALLEVNSRAGAATRWLSRCAERVLHAWPSTLPKRGRESARSLDASAAAREHPLETNLHRWIGPPLSPSMFRRGASGDDEGRARTELGFDPQRPLLVVLGGSQGSGALNAFVRAHAPALVAGGAQILHQTGPNKLGEACPAFTGYRALEFIDPIETALSAATLVLCRGGASTLAEVAAMRCPAIVVPYPHHADQHQDHNARELGRGVCIIPEARLGVAARDEIARLCSASAADERAIMRAELASAVPEDAARRLFEELCTLARARRARRERATVSS